MENTPRKRKNTSQINIEDEDDEASSHVPNPTHDSRRNRRRKRRHTTDESAETSNQKNASLVGDLLRGDATYDDMRVDLLRSASMPLPNQTDPTQGLLDHWLIRSIIGLLPFHRPNTRARPPSTAAQQPLTSLPHRPDTPSTHSHSSDDNTLRTHSFEVQKRRNRSDRGLVSRKYHSRTAQLQTRSSQACPNMADSFTKILVEQPASSPTSSNDLEPNSSSDISVDNLGSTQDKLMDNALGQLGFERRSSPEPGYIPSLSPCLSSTNCSNNDSDTESDVIDDSSLAQTLLSEIAAEDTTDTTEQELPLQHGWPPTSKPVEEHKGEDKHLAMLAILCDNGKDSPVSVFCDSGVPSAFITAACADRLELELQPLSVKDTHVYRGINGQDFEPKFYVTIGLKIKGVENGQLLAVKLRVLASDGQDQLEEFLEEFAHDIILGWNFLDQHSIWRSPWVKPRKKNNSDFLVIIQRPASKAQKERMEKDRLEKQHLALKLAQNMEASRRQPSQRQLQAAVDSQKTQAATITQRASPPAIPKRVDSSASKWTVDSGYASMHSVGRSSTDRTDRRSSSRSPGGSSKEPQQSPG